MKSKAIVKKKQKFTINTCEKKTYMLKYKYI